MVVVSVLMTSYNHEKYISEAIDSVLNQTFKDLELIIVDDCSVDSSLKIIADYQKKDPRVKASFHQKNMGISKTINDCLNKVNGEYVSFIGSDDLWIENKLEKQLKILEKDNNKLVWAEGTIINSQGIETGKLLTEFLNAPLNKNGDVFQELLKEDFVFAQTLIFKSAYIKELRFDEELKYVNDHRFIVDLSVNKQFIFMPEVLAKYRLHGSNTTFKDETGWLKDKIILRKYFLDKYGDKMSNELKAEINYKIGYFLSRLSQKNEAKQYYLQALKFDHFHSIGALYLVLALTSGDGFLGNKLTALYYSARSRSDKLSAKLPKQFLVLK